MVNYNPCLRSILALPRHSLWWWWSTWMASVCPEHIWLKTWTSFVYTRFGSVRPTSAHNYESCSSSSIGRPSWRWIFFIRVSHYREIIPSWGTIRCLHEAPSETCVAWWGHCTHTYTHNAHTYTYAHTHTHTHRGGGGGAEVILLASRLVSSNTGFDELLSTPISGVCMRTFVCVSARARARVCMCRLFSIVSRSLSSGLAINPSVPRSCPAINNHQGLQSSRRSRFYCHLSSFLCRLAPSYLVWTSFII